MSKPLIGVLLGAVLGFLDGLTALFAGPEVKPMLMGILIGSTVKGMLAGVIIGLVARKMISIPKGILFGLAIGLVLAFIVAAMPDEQGRHWWAEIMIPGSLVGLILGFATQKMGKPAPKTL